MKLQELAIIFIIIILPISLLLSAYTQFQINTINKQTAYDARLTKATYDAIKAFQLNMTNSTTSDLANSKLRDLEASVNAFRNSIKTAFDLGGYSNDEIDNYIPALVYTLYDGFYIYSPYNNENYRYDENGNKIDNNGETIYGLKPYISYSVRYKNGRDDIVITYSLDNYINIQGNIKDSITGQDEYVNKSGYLIDGINYDEENDKVFYNGIEIKEEKLLENVAGETLQYIKENGTKYYLREDYLQQEDGSKKDCIIYFFNGQLKVQSIEGTDDFNTYKSKMENNDSAKQYYINAYKFTEWVKNKTLLENFKYCDVYDEVINEDGETSISQVFPNDNRFVFQFVTRTGPVNIENELSNFNQHRLAVIRHKIETNLAIAISNYNQYSQAENVFQMPELKENEWDHIINNVSVISFLQGLNIGGKIYNGYTFVTNAESQEVVLEENIYILGQDTTNFKYNYYKIGDKGLEDGSVIINSYNYGDKKSAGRINLDFERQSIMVGENYYYYYPLKAYNASYTSVVMQDKVTTYDDIYKYVNEQSDELKEAFYTALGRERYSVYKAKNIIN